MMQLLYGYILALPDWPLRVLSGTPSASLDESDAGCY